MKQGSEYAKRIRRLLTQLQRKFGKPETVDGVDPTEQLIIGILAGCTTHAKALAVYRKLRQHVVDLNELRVTPAMELAEQIGEGVPLARLKAQRIVDALNAVRKRQDSLDMTFLKQRGRREAREYLESLEGVDRAAAASVVLFSLGGHAIPLDGLMLHILRKEEFVDASAEPAEVQAFLERCVSASHAHVFYELLCRYVSSKPLKVPYERVAELIRPAAAEAIKQAPLAAVAPVGAPVASVAPPKPAAPAAPAKPAGAAPKSAAAKSASSKGLAAPPSEKSGGKKPRSRENRLAVAPKAGTNHNRAASKPAAVRKKK